jgi:hypothetical protein
VNHKAPALRRLGFWMALVLLIAGLLLRCQKAALSGDQGATNG